MVSDIRAILGGDEPEPIYDGPLPRVLRLLDVQREDTVPLWAPYHFRRKVGLVEGDPGVGKSYLMAAIAAAVSLGRRPLRSEQYPPEDVLLLSAEDGAADTLRPRLEAMGADLSRIHVLTGIITEVGDEPILLDESGLLALEQAIAEIQPAFVNIDPLIAYVGSAVDMHRANEVRAVMKRLGDIAQTYNCAIVGVRHLNKSGGTYAAYRGQGSIDFFAAARSVVHVGKDPDEPSRTVMAHVKCNLGPLGESIAFSIRDGVFGWIGPVQTTAAQLMATASEDHSELERAVAFLDAHLPTGSELPAREIFEAAEANGIARKTLLRAKERRHVESDRIGEPGKRGGGQWVWRRVSDDDQSDIKVPTTENDHLNTDGPVSLPDIWRPDGEKRDQPAPTEVGHLNRVMEGWPSKSEPERHDCGRLLAILGNGARRCTSCHVTLPEAT